MSYKKTLQIILVIAIIGTLFSGYLSYYELFVPAGCGAAVVSCGPNPVTIASLPACVYGLFMYLSVLVLTSISLWNNRKPATD